jgi:putative ABC transport system permease protein
MRLRTLLSRELRARPGPALACTVAVLLGVATLVAVRTVTVHAEAAVARDLDALGANVLILPRDVTPEDYYAADLHGRTLPEEYAERLTLSSLEGVDNLSPKLCVRAQLAGGPVTVTGILPLSEFRAKAAWGGAGIFARPAGCGAEAEVPGAGAPPDPAALARRRVIEALGQREALVGADVAARAGLREGDTVRLLGAPFMVLAVLPPTGTVDDARVFIHLHAAQQLAGLGEVVNVIEVVGCCKQIAAGLAEKVAELLPGTKVVTVSQVVRTQQQVNRLMAGLSLALLGVLLTVSAGATAAALYGNVRERRREVGTLIALGAPPGLVLRLFVGKALVLGLAGGLGGAALGSGLAVWLGPGMAHAAVRPLPLAALGAAGLAAAAAVVGSLVPAWRAARLDPCTCLREV